MMGFAPFPVSSSRHQRSIFHRELLKGDSERLHDFFPVLKFEHNSWKVKRNDRLYSNEIHNKNTLTPTFEYGVDNMAVMYT